MPVDGGGRRKGAADGVSGTPADGPGEGVSGRTAAGESGGSAYPNPHSGQTEPLPHGGQPRVKFYGGSGPASGDGKPSPNAPDRPQGEDAARPVPAPAPAAEREPHVVKAAHGSFAVVEESGVAAAEATGAVPRQEGSD